jgi:hypothetical protein
MIIHFVKSPITVEQRDHLFKFFPVVDYLSMDIANTLTQFAPINFLGLRTKGDTKAKVSG